MSDKITSLLLWLLEIYPSNDSLYLSESRSSHKKISLHLLMKTQEEKEILLHLLIFLLIILFLPSWCSKIPPFIVSFLFRELPIAILLAIGLLMTIVLSFSSLENVLTFLSFLKDIFAGYRILGWQFFLFSILKMLHHLLLASIISVEKSTSSCFSSASTVFLSCCFKNCFDFYFWEI